MHGGLESRGLRRSKSVRIPSFTAFLDRGDTLQIDQTGENSDKTQIKPKSSTTGLFSIGAGGQLEASCGGCRTQHGGCPKGPIGHRAGGLGPRKPQGSYKMKSLKHS